MKYSRISRAESFPVLGRASTFQKMFHITLAVQDANHMNGIALRQIINTNGLEPGYGP